MALMVNSPCSLLRFEIVKNTIISAMRTRPWIRFWARSLDYALWGFVYGIAVAVFWPDNVFLTNPLIASVLITGSWILPEAMLMAIAGSTPGKALLNVKVSFEGTAAEVDDAWIERGLRVWALGLGIGLPVVSWVAAAISHRDLTATGITSWDRKCRFAVQHGHVGWAVGIVTAILIVAPFALAGALKNTGTAYTKFQPGTSAATLPQVVPSIDDLYDSIAPKPGAKQQSAGEDLYDQYAPKAKPPGAKKQSAGEDLYDSIAPKPGAKLGSNTQERDALPDNIPIGLARNNDALEFVRKASGPLEKRFPNLVERVDFLKVVHYEAIRAGLDPQMVLALIGTVSDFRPHKIGAKGARGYMQVNPAWVNKIGRPGDNLFALRTNLRYGCTVLRHYLDTENGDLYRALNRYRIDMEALQDNRVNLAAEEFANSVLKLWISDFKR